MNKNPVTSDLLISYVKYHNRGISSGNFKKLFELFAPDAKIKFENINFKTLHGLSSIIGAFSSNPPTDKLILRDVKDLDENIVVSNYCWRKNPELISGKIMLQKEKNFIKKIFIKRFI